MDPFLVPTDTTDVDIRFSTIPGRVVLTTIGSDGGVSSVYLDDDQALLAILALVNRFNSTFADRRCTVSFKLLEGDE